MDVDPRSVLFGLLLIGAVAYGWWRNFRSRESAPPRGEGAVVSGVILVLLVGLLAWQVLER